jgi:hypothetical protein
MERQRKRAVFAKRGDARETAPTLSEGHCVDAPTDATDPTSRPRQ